MDRYPAPAAKQRFDTIVKRNRFITTVLAVPDKRADLIAIQTMRSEFPDAHHNNSLYPNWILTRCSYGSMS